MIHSDLLNDNVREDKRALRAHILDVSRSQNDAAIMRRQADSEHAEVDTNQHTISSRSWRSLVICARI